ncbi:hypothetical protein ACF0H5_018453 [Mactra antiquata]
MEFTIMGSQLENSINQRTDNIYMTSTCIDNNNIKCTCEQCCLCTQLPDIPKFRHGTRYRINGYAHRPLANGAPQIVKKIFTGQLTPTYFNDICYGRKETPREFMFNTPGKERTKELWEPKRVSREQARHVIRDIQDARFRKQTQLEKVTRKKEKERVKRTEGALIRESEIVPRGLQAYLVKLDKQKEKYEAKRKSRKVNRKATEAT